MMGDEKKKKVIKPEDEKKRIKEMAREDKFKKIRERDMKLFGPNEEDARGLALIKAGGKMINKKAGGKIGMGMTKNNYKKGGKVSSCSKRADGCAKRGKTKGRMV